MYKKLITLVTTLIILSTIAYFGYKYYIYYYPPNGTGAAPSEINEVEIQKGEAINNLIKSLPIQFDNFAIESYDYSKGKFRVVLNSKLNASPEILFNWLSVSEYKSIPAEMFNISFSN